MDRRATVRFDLFKAAATSPRVSSSSPAMRTAAAASGTRRGRRFASLAGGMAGVPTGPAPTLATYVIGSPRRAVTSIAGTP
jgi:hypothetical protein